MTPTEGTPEASPSSRLGRLLQPRLRIFYFAILTGLSVWAASTLVFSYDFEQFFPTGDPDLAFFYEFRDKFEPDDNVLLVGLPAPGASIFEQGYLERVDSLTSLCENISLIEQTLSLTSYRYFIKSPFGFVDYAAVHPAEPERFERDSLRLSSDPRVPGFLVTEDFDASMLVMRTGDSLPQPHAESIMEELHLALEATGFEESAHILGRANFQVVLVEQQQREFIFMTVASGTLVLIIFLILFRKPLNVAISLVSVLLGMVLFLGFLGAIGRPLNFLSVLYPVLMIIVGVSDVVHILSKYIFELRLGKTRWQAISATQREIGIAILLTSITTAIGFLTLITSRVPPVREFGQGAAAGVLIAYVAVLGFMTAALVLFPSRLIAAKLGPAEAKSGSGQDGWSKLMAAVYRWGKRNNRWVPVGAGAFLVFAIIGIARVSTDVYISEGLPRGHQITEDFHWFEQKAGGFRPFEIAAIAGSDYQVDDPIVIRAVDSLEDRMRDYGIISEPQSLVMLYKTVNRASKGDREREYKLPDTDRELSSIKRSLQRLPESGMKVLISDDGKYARISANIQDVGTDSINAVINELMAFADGFDQDVVQFRETGTGIIFDKNNEYLRRSLIQGLSIAFLAVSLLMAALFRNWRMVFVSLVPNIFPLLFGAAMMGYLGIELDAETAIIFAISFGIAVDDTIHFLSKLKWEFNKGTAAEEAIRLAFVETGKAILLTSTILLFGFLILLTSANPGTTYVGLLIALTLGSALVADLTLIPWMIRKGWAGKVAPVEEELVAQGPNQ